VPGIIHREIPATEVTQWQGECVMVGLFRSLFSRSLLSCPGWVTLVVEFYGKCG
jgi:hypothetical protein